MRKVAIILPTKDNETQLDHAIDSLLNSTQYDNFKIIIVESNSKPFHEFSKVKHLERNWQKIKEKIKWFPEVKIVSTSSEGINIKAINIGIKETIDEDILLIHDDMNFFRLYRRDWLAEMASVDYAQSAVGMVTYFGNTGRSGPEYIDQMPWIGSWFCYIPRETINKIGIMDEDFEIGEDIDYSFRVQKEGLRLAVTDFWFEHHQVRDTPHNSQTEEIKKRNAERFRKKHNIEEKNGL